MSNLDGPLWYLPIDGTSILAWLNESYSNVLEYSEMLDRAYIQDEDGDDGIKYIPSELVRQLIADGALAIWRDIGQWNYGYNTYKTPAWVAAWKREHSVVVEA